MISLNDRKWKAFSIKDIFVTINDEKQVPTGAYIEKKYLHQGDTPRITVTSNNNGIDNFWWTEHKNNRSFSNFISVNFLGDAFYHPYNASLDMKVHCLKLKNRELNKNLALFLCAMLMNNTKNSNYGNQLSSTDIVSKHILLPVDISGAPDYYFMETFAKERLANKQSEYIDYAKAQLAQIERERVDNAVKWLEFRIEDLFEIKSGKRLVKSDIKYGDRPFIGASDSNNGITAWCFNTNSTIDSNVLGVNYNGSVVENFYHPYECIFSDDVKRFRLKNINGDKYLYLFIKTALIKQKNKYRYAYKFNEKRMNRQTIMLPAIDNKPNYVYMSNYIKNVFADKYTEYLDYAQKTA